MKTKQLLHQLKWEEMPGNRLKQLIYESDHCKRILHLMEESNIQNKDSISRLLKDNLNRESLADIETFHNRFITQDNVIGILRKDIAFLDQLLTLKPFQSDEITDVISIIKNLRIAMEKAEEQFNKLKLDFNIFLATNIFYS